MREGSRRQNEGGHATGNTENVEGANTIEQPLRTQPSHSTQRHLLLLTSNVETPSRRPFPSPCLAPFLRPSSP